MTNGVSKKIHRASKRKLPEKISKKRVHNISKREPSNTEGSISDSNASNQSSSPESNGTDASEWGTKVKRLRRDNNPKFQKRLRPRNLKHKKHSRSPLLRHTRSSGLRSRSSSLENPVVNIKKSPEKSTLSPLHTRSQRHLRERDRDRHRNRAPYIHHCLRATTLKPQKYQSSGDSSESDESVHNRRSARVSNSSSSSNTCNSLKRQRNVNPKRQITNKNRESLSNESEESSEKEEEEKPRSSTRATATTKDKPNTRRALTGALTKEKPMIQTRNRGQRTVRYGEESDEDRNSDSENTEPMFSFSSRGRLRKLTTHARAFFRE